MLEVKNITKVYKTDSFKQTALNKVSVSFRKSEFVSVLGASGSGKTTLLNIIGGLDKYDSGDIIIDGISTKKYTDRDWDTYRNHRIGFVFQSYNLIPHGTVLSNVILALTLSGIDKSDAKKRAIDALEKVGLKDHIYKKPTELSGGQMQRVAIARALVNDPDIILADEPTGALDSNTSIQIMDILKELSKTKLVIMVTHNPELAKNYSSRIIELKDGVIISDSNPYKSKKESKSEGNVRKTSMSFLTAMSLSLNNLMTKKGRTFLTSFAGSIGIIGIALILSLSNGIHKFIERTEEETLTSYPIVIENKSVDISGMVSAITGNKNTLEYDDDKIHSVNIMGDMFTSMTNEVKNNDLVDFKNYIDKNNSILDYVTDIKYGYNTKLNLYKEDGLRVNPTKVLDTIGMNTGGMSNFYSSYMSNYDVFFELIDNKKLLERQYDIVSGKLPDAYNEMVLIVDEFNTISDYTLYSLGILDQDDLKKEFNKLAKGEKVEFKETEYNPSDLIGLTYKIVLNSDYYKKEGNIWVNMENDDNYLKDIIKKSEEVKIVGIIKPSDSSVGSSRDYGTVGYTHELVEHLVNENNKRDIVKEQIKNPKINVFTGVEFSDKKFDMSSMSNEEKMYLSTLKEDELAKVLKTMQDNYNSTYEDNLITLGISKLEEPTRIEIYPKDFDSKENIEEYINKYNENKTEEEKISYTDIVGLMMSSITTIVDVITDILIAFVAISLVVSSIMIAIITYISVIERTKEIGILRAIGASKKDISRVFKAETIIEGFAAGVMGILVTLLLCIPINLIVKHITDVPNIAVTPIDGAIILIIISVVLTLIAGLIPAKIASKKNPVEALRTE